MHTIFTLPNTGTILGRVLCIMCSSHAALVSNSSRGSLVSNNTTVCITTRLPEGDWSIGHGATVTYSVRIRTEQRVNCDVDINQLNNCRDTILCCAMLHPQCRASSILPVASNICTYNVMANASFDASSSSTPSPRLSGPSVSTFCG